MPLKLASAPWQVWRRSCQLACRRHRFFFRARSAARLPPALLLSKPSQLRHSRELPALAARLVPGSADPDLQALYYQRSTGPAKRGVKRGLLQGTRTLLVRALRPDGTSAFNQKAR
jgi:hypothetical protein